MFSQPAVTLFDIASSVASHSWSHSTWKARLVLNYKHTPYKTVWVAYPDIESKLKELGGHFKIIDLDGKPQYALPVILDETGDAPVLVADSLVIAEYLDAKHPERPVFSKDAKALQYTFQETFNRIIGPHFGRMLLPLAWSVLDARSRMYFRETRERLYGSARFLTVWNPETTVTEKDWELLENGFDTLATFLDKNGPGATYVSGKEPSRADMIIVAHLASIVATAPEEWDRRVRKWSGGKWERLWIQTESWRVIH